ncbi:hypothetical protein [Mannheimia pernigra]|uniref:hypothetical protein n=1 Tax=Mannheimia pernigra TaxID=111844 RepID=UPI001EE23799|nr:hypothetical protein [Mannheimia pernigra]
MTIIKMNQEYDKIVLDAQDKKLAEVMFLMSDIMKNGHGRLVSAASFGVIDKFMSGIKDNGDKIDFSKYTLGKSGNIELTHNDIVELIYTVASNKEDARLGIRSFLNYNINTNSADYAKRSLVFGSFEALLDTKNIRYVIDSKGNPVGVKNYSVSIKDDNYDYNSTNVNKYLNLALKNLLSYGNDHIVKLKFIEDRKENELFKDISISEYGSILQKYKRETVFSKEWNTGALAVRGNELLMHQYVMPLSQQAFLYSVSANILALERLNNFLRNSEKGLQNYSSQYWPNYGLAQKNKFDITTNRSTPLINNPEFFDATKHKQIGVNKETLNALIDPKSISMSNMLTDNFRWANYNLSKDAINIPKYQPKFWSNQYETIMLNRSLGNRPNIPVDPLILDLNDDGAKAVSYNDKPVLFDIDNDGGSLEETGWLSHQDGLLVRDLNNNSKIDNMSEVFSEYYAGKAGRNGESGEKRFKNGFEALRTLDSNKDNIFDSKDTDFNKVRIWQDKNHNGLTDSGELQTLSSLGITAIDLTYQEMGGQLFSGNELLAKGNFIRNGKKQEAVAVNFLANPRGHTITNVAGGKKTVTEGSGLIAGTSSFTATDCN